MKTYIYIALLITVSLGTYYFGYWRGQKTGVGEGYDSGELSGLIAVLDRDVTQIVYSSHAIDMIDKKDYEKVYDLKCKSLYSGAVNLLLLRKEFPDSPLMKGEHIDAYLRYAARLSIEKPQTLVFLSSDLVDRNDDGSLRENDEKIKKGIDELRLEYSKKSAEQGAAGNPLPAE